MCYVGMPMRKWSNFEVSQFVVRSVAWSQRIHLWLYSWVFKVGFASSRWYSGDDRSHLYSLGFISSLVRFQKDWRWSLVSYLLLHPMSKLRQDYIGLANIQNMHCFNTCTAIRKDRNHIGPPCRVWNVLASSTWVKRFLNNHHSAFEPKIFQRSERDQCPSPPKRDDRPSITAGLCSWD